MDQFALGWSHDVVGLAFPYECDVGLADHSAIHHPNPFCGSVFFLNHFHDVFHGGHVHPISAEQFVGKRQVLRNARQPDIHLIAIRTAVTGLSPLRFGVLVDLPLKNCARHVVEQSRPKGGRQPAGRGEAESNSMRTPNQAR